MATKKTEITNLALLRIGVSQLLVNVDDLTDTSSAASNARAVWDIERSFVLRDFPWPFARKYANPLTLVTGSVATPANPDWIYAYRWPLDCEFVRRIVNCYGRQDCSPPPFVVGRDPAVAEAAAWAAATLYAQNAVVSNQGKWFVALRPTQASLDSPLDWAEIDPRLIFTNQTTAGAEYTVDAPAEEFDETACSMLAWRLAAAMAPALSRMTDVVKACLESYAEERARAWSRAVQEGEYAIASGEADPRIRDIFNLAVTRVGISRNVAVADPELTLANLWPRVCFDNERDFVLRDFPWGFATGYAVPLLGLGSTTTPYSSDWVFAFRTPVNALTVRRIVTSIGRKETNLPPFQMGHDPNVLTATAWSAVTAYVAGNVVSYLGKYYQSILAGTNHTPPNATYWTEIDCRLILTNHRVLNTAGNPTLEIETTVTITDPQVWDASFHSMLAWRLAALLAQSIAKTDKDGPIVARCLQNYEFEKSRAQRMNVNEGQEEKPQEAEWIREGYGSVSDNSGWWR